MNMMRMSSMRTSIHTGTALAALSIGLLAAPVATQEAQAETAAEPAIAAGEIVVTAQRREQRLNDVGIAVANRNAVCDEDCVTVSDGVDDTDGIRRKGKIGQRPLRFRASALDGAQTSGRTPTGIQTATGAATVSSLPSSAAVDSGTHTPTAAATVASSGMSLSFQRGRASGHVRVVQSSPASARRAATDTPCRQAL